MSHGGKSQSELAGLVREMTGQDVASCYQCGKCTAGCPMAAFVDLAPNQVMRLAQAGDEAAAERVLSSATLWCCAGCLTCTQRCPKELDPAAVMDALRQIAHARGRIPPRQRKVLAFHRAFLDTVRKNGRMSEVPLIRRYKTALLAMASPDLFSDLLLAPVTLLKGKLPLRSHKIKRRNEIRRIFDECEKHVEFRISDFRFRIEGQANSSPQSAIRNPKSEMDSGRMPDTEGTG